MTLAACLIFMTAHSGRSLELFVSPSGSDHAEGTIRRPLATLATAVARISGKKGVVTLRQGTHYLSQTLTLGPEHSGLTIRGYKGETATISGGQKLSLAWKPFRNGIYQAQVPASLSTEELFVDGQRQVLARYPNFDPNQRIFNGFAADAISKERVARWKSPAGGYFHAMHPAEWGDYTWRITGKNSSGEVDLEGGWQNNRPAGPHSSHRFVENIFEELDAPGEWFLDSATHTLYFMPPSGMDLAKATVEAVRLKTLIALKGTESNPAKGITLQNLDFRHAARTMMETREPMLRTDWAIYRGGAILFEGATDCRMESCLLDQLGGNAIFVNHYNRRLTFKSLHITKAGATGIHFVGDPNAARSPLFRYEQTQPLEKIDPKPGPKTNNYPADCLVEDCLITLTGRNEKQTAGINIDLAQSITVRHCSIYDMPRAGINIGDGCWGGHVIEFCDVFDTVKETGDHGSFNSWGRDRFWNPDTSITNRWVAANPEMPFLDMVKPNILRNNRWRCDHGWDIDLDDGSSNYVITNNLCLNGGIKNREGYRRTVANNVIVNNGFHPHVWYTNSGDSFRNNIVWSGYAPAIMYAKPWPEGLDDNFFYVPGHAGAPTSAKQLQDASGRDVRSLAGNAMFVNPLAGDYRIRPGSPALALGFKNFPMDRFGVTSPKLRKLARTPLIPDPNQGIRDGKVRSVEVVEWQGMKVRNIVGQGEMSAYGTPGENGVLVLEVPESIAGSGIRRSDVILSVNDESVYSISDLPPSKGRVRIGLLRNQQRVTVNL